MNLNEAIAELTREVNKMVKRAEAEKRVKEEAEGFFLDKLADARGVSWIQVGKTIIRADQIAALVEDRFESESSGRFVYGENPEQKAKGYDYVNVYLKDGGRVTVYDTTAEEIMEAISHISGTL